MATHLVHLLIADTVCRAMKLENRSEYLFGTMAPDSGKQIPGELYSFDPPKELTHFIVKNGKPHNIKDLHFLKKYPYLNATGKIDDFRLGYFHHLVTDNLWSDIVNLPTKKKYKDRYSADREEYWKRVKMDWYGAEVSMAAHRGRDIFFDCLPDETSRGMRVSESSVPFIDAVKMINHIRHLRTEYESRLSPENLEAIGNHAFVYWNHELSEKFITRASEYLCSITSRILGIEYSEDSILEISPCVMDLITDGTL